MKQIITKSSISVIDYGGESFSKYLKLFDKYFSHGMCHYNEDHITYENSISIYSFINNKPCFKCNSKKRNINIPMLEKSFKPCQSFYDRMSIGCGQSDNIFYDSTLIGMYCEKKNILSLSDISHSEEDSLHVYHIINTLEKEGILKIIKKEKSNNKITLGTDPEFESVICGDIILGNYLPRISTHNKIYISADAAGNQREIRPDPSDIPEELVENIKDLIKISSFFGEDLSVVGEKFSLGGHIHIGGTPPTDEIILILDYFLHPFNEFNSEQRKNSKYGKEGDYRYQPHGFEYRTPPSAWLLTPKIALMVLQLVKVAVEKIINGYPVEISNDHEIEEYKENLKSLGFDDEWVINFINEIKFVKENINTPLAKMWKVEIPKKYRSKKSYICEPEIDFE